MSWQAILQQLAAGQQQLDRQTQEECARVRNNERVGIFCRSGCSNCCSLTVNCSFAEVLPLAGLINSEQRASLDKKIEKLREISQQASDLKDFLRRFREQLGGCPLLTADGSCGLYSQRPYSCRALLSTRNSNWCAVDFASLHPLEKQAFLSSLDPELVAFPTHYLAAPQEIALELEALLLLAMREQFGVALAGNFLYQIWLELEHRLSEIIPQGFAATRNYLEQNQLDLPFLLQLQGEAKEA